MVSINHLENYGHCKLYYLKASLDNSKPGTHMTHIHYQGRFLVMQETDGWEFVSRQNRSDVVIIVAVTPDNKLLLVEQYRIPVAANTIELPAGLVGDIPEQTNEPLEIAARRELLEETGYIAEQLKLLHQGPTSAGLTDEKVNLFLASQLQQVGPGGGDASENITVHKIDLDQVPAWLNNQHQAGKLLDPKIYAALYWLQSTT